MTEERRALGFQWGDPSCSAPPASRRDLPEVGRMEMYTLGLH